MSVTLLSGLLLYAVFPLWLLAGLVDYTCHRATRIEQTTSTAESSLHVLQYLQIVAAVALGLFLEPTSLVLVLILALALLHLVTGYVDIAYTTPRRYISPPEQHVHSYMEILPLVATALVVLIHWDAFAAVFGGEGSWRLAPRRDALPAGVLIAVGVGLFFAGAAIAEELVRCRRAAR